MDGEDELTTPEDAILGLRHHCTCPCCYCAEVSGEVLWKEIERMRAAIKGIAPWLSASLNDEHCAEYRAACEAVFECDPVET